jgi:transcriptional regulator with XRE-family HTH domain
MTPQESFVTRLRRHRLRNQISLEEIASATRVKRELLESLENNDLSGWPQGLYARAWIRGYASVVGLDPEDTVEDFCRLYSNGDRRTHGTIREIAAIVASPSEYRDEFPHEDRRRPAGHVEGGVAAPVSTQPTAVPWHTPIVNALRPLWLRLSSLVPAQKSLRGGLN